jgi:hypothetical protein
MMCVSAYFSAIFFKLLSLADFQLEVPMLELKKNYVLLIFEKLCQGVISFFRALASASVATRTHRLLLSQVGCSFYFSVDG